MTITVIIDGTPTTVEVCKNNTEAIANGCADGEIYASQNDYDYVLKVCVNP